MKNILLGAGNKLKVRTKLIIGFSVIVVLLWLICFFTWVTFANLNRQFSAMEEDIIPDTIAMTEVETISSEIYRDVTEYLYRDYLYHGIEEAKNNALLKLGRLEEIGLEYLPTMALPGMIEHGKDCILAGKIFDFYFSTMWIIDLKERGADFSKLLGRDRTMCLPALLAMQQRASELKAASIAELTTVKTAFNDAYTDGVRSVFTCAGLIVLLTIAAALFTTRSIVRPLHALRKGTEMIAKGKLDYKVGTDARDEIGELSRAFDQMTKSLSKSMTSIDNLNQEIAERKRAEKKLRESQEFVSSLLENAPHAIVVINPDTSIRYVNPSWEELNGWTLSEIIGTKAPYPWWPDEYKESFLDGFKEAMKQGSGQAEIIAQKKNGEIYWIDMNWASVTHNGKMRYLLINSIDITKRKQAEEALRESEERFSKAFHASPEVMAITTLKDGKYLEVNESFTRVTGYTRKEVIGRKTTDINIWANPEDRKKMLQKMKKEGRFYNEECQFRIKSGEVLTMLFSAEKINISGVPCMLGVCVDITGRKRAEKLQQDENYVLTLLGQGAELSELLDAIVRLGEYHDPAIKGSVMLFDASKQCLFQAAAPSLPDSYLKLLENGLPIGPNMGSCGTAAYLKERVIVPDIGNSPLFPYDEAIKQTINIGLVACWSQPIISSSGELLGTIANYGSKVGEPSADNLRVLEWSARIAAIAIEHKRAEEALRESEEKFSKAFHASPGSMSISRLKDGIFIEVNESFLKDKGYTREEVIGYSSKELSIWKDEEHRNEILQMLEEKGRVHNEPTQFRTKSGDLRTGYLSAELISLGNEPCMLVLTTDVTQLKQAEEQLQLLGSVTQQVSDSIIVTDPDFRITYMNQAAQRLFGYTIEEALGQKLGIFNDKPIEEKERQEILETLSSGKVWSGTAIRRRKDGSTLICDCRLSPLFDEKGEICSYIDVQRNITKQKEVEAKLQVQKQLIERILATMPEGVLVIDSNDRIILANEAFHNIFHDGKKPISNKLLNEIIPVNQLLNLYKAVKKGKENNTLEFRYQVKDLEKRIYCVITKMDGERTLLTFTDVSQEREEEEKLYLTDRLASIGEMAAGLAHELNNPLTGVLALSQLLMDSDIPKEHREDLQCVYSEAKRAASIVKNVLLFARYSNNENGRASTNEVVKDVLRLREYEEKVSNIKAVTNLQENLPDIPMDKFQLQQVFLNIILNAEAAIKETNRPGILKVTTERVNNHINIHFKDNGCGIKKNILPRIFDPFFTTKDIGKGTGLGLSICYGIVVKHGGKISVETRVNKGTTFTIKLPVVPETA